MRFSLSSFYRHVDIPSSHTSEKALDLKLTIAALIKKVMLV